MKIYEFSTWFCGNNLYSVKEIEVEEKPKTYVAKGCRINKCDIDMLDSHYGHRMYRLTNDPTLYIDKMVSLREHQVIRAQNDLKLAIDNLETWKTLQSNIKED